MEVREMVARLLRALWKVRNTLPVRGKVRNTLPVRGKVRNTLPVRGKGDSPREPLPVGEGGKAHTTVLMYLDGSSPELAVPYQKRLAAMERAMSQTKGINVVARFARDPGWLGRLAGQWKGTRTFSLQSPAFSSQRAVSPLTEEELFHFLRENVKAYPAQQYLFVYKGHSAAPPDLGNLGRRLPLEELANAMRRVERDTGARIGVTLIDSCHAGGVETAEELHAATDFLVASPGAPRALNFPYEALLRALASPSASPRDLAQKILEVARAGPDEHLLFDLEKIPAFNEALDEFASGLLTLLSPARVKECLTEGLRRSNPDAASHRYVSLTLLAEAVAKHPEVPPSVRESARALNDAIPLLCASSGKGASPHIRGAYPSLWRRVLGMDVDYERLQIARRTRWGALLQKVHKSTTFA